MKLKEKEEKELHWDEGASLAASRLKLKTLKKLPKMQGITPDTAKGLRWKSFKYMLAHDKGWKITKHVLRHPLRYGWRYFRSLFRKEAYKRDEDFFYYGISSEDDFQKLMVDSKSLMILGFSYCHKPYECPSGRFTDQCVHNPEHDVCRQCFIGKAMHFAPKRRVKPVFIKTVHHIGEEVFKAVHGHPDKQVIFLITACEMTLEMFADWGNMAGIKGIGVRLDGRICNTMRAFEISEEGIKPGLTVVLDKTQRRILNLLEEGA